ncbi:HAT protein [Hirschfeldia incana]|nr:HAT protein [Hirschfeldia incana]
MDNRDLAPGSSSEMTKNDSLDGVEKKDKEAVNALAKFFVRGGVNPNTIRFPSFTNFTRLLNPNFRPTVPLLEREVLGIHGECKEKAKNFLKAFQGKLTLSYEDSVKGPVLHEDFVCITAHFVDDDWKVRKWILGYASEVGLVATDDLYVHGFRNAVEGFEIENKVSALLLPNDEGFDEETLGGFRKGLEEKGDNVFLVYCCADLFRLMVDGVFRDLSGKLLEDLRMLVNWGKCESENWNLWVSNLQRAVDMKNEDEFSKDEIYDDYDKPSDEEWVKIETFSKLVGCIYKVAVELFEGGYSTSNVYFYLLAELKVMLEKEVDGGESDYLRCNAKWMLKRFDKYWDQMFLVLATASVLDPRFKMKYLEFYCSKKMENDGGSKAESVLEYLRSLYVRYAASGICQKPICPVAATDSKEEDDNDDGGEDCDEKQDGEEGNEDEGEGEDYEDDEEEEDYDEEEEEEEEGDSDDEVGGEERYDSDTSEEVEREARKKRKEKPDACKDFALFQEFLKFEGSSPREFGETELDAYLKEPVMEWNKDFKALDWWREEGGHKYPVLSRVARDVLSIPISRATSYYAYGMDRREPPAFVVSLEAEVANAMMCSKRWLRL